MEIESEQDTDVRSGGRPDSAFSGDSFRNAGTENASCRTEVVLPL